MSVYAAVDWTREHDALDVVDDVLHRTLGSLTSVDRQAFQRRFEQTTSFSVDQTGFSPLMLYFLYTTAGMTGSRRLVGCGVYGGIAFSMLAAGAVDAVGEESVVAIGVDDDDQCVTSATANAEILGLGRQLEYCTRSPLAFLSEVEAPIDLVMLDVYDPVRHKEDYVPLAALAEPRLRRGGVLLAHDACIPRYGDDVEALSRWLRESGQFDGPWKLPIDDTGILLAVRR